ncbi:mitogen-activated protein kinase kinase kinase kinase 2-like [Cyprinus carpio]|uniref:Mitogen-activated protein kinase kinase kinase kinase 2-like n=1 Tax=Cyprinus carpio TaxID=7962 RepID=A0A9Q9ZML5_CYPCA|nr:mitogen-activated protein kinase kinase kinase kinase 2-like [Cyprinus carpio]
MSSCDFRDYVHGCVSVCLQTCSVLPDKIHSLAKRPIHRTRSEEQFDHVKFGPPMRKETDPCPDLGAYDDWSSISADKDSPSLLECVEEALMERSLTIKRGSSAEYSLDEEDKYGTVKRVVSSPQSTTVTNQERKAPTPCSLSSPLIGCTPLKGPAPDSNPALVSESSFLIGSTLSDLSLLTDSSFLSHSTSLGSLCSTPTEGLIAESSVAPDPGGTKSHFPPHDPPLSPEWSTLRRKPDDSKVVHGLPPTPQVHMGACFSKVFNGCPLKTQCAVTWVLPKTRDQYLMLGAEEGIYTLNLNELHEDTMEKLLPQRCSWLYVMNNVLMSISGKSSQLSSHSLPALFEYRRNMQRRQGNLVMNAHRLSTKISARRYAMSVKIPDTKGCRRCSVVRNPYTDSVFLCAAVPTGLVLLMWYEPLQKFMQLKHIALNLPDSLPVFELLVNETEELPQVCVGVRSRPRQKDNTGQMHFDIIHLDDKPQSLPDGESLEVKQVIQLDRDTVLIALKNTVRVVNLQGCLSHQKTSELAFEFPIQTLVCLQDSVLVFWKHGLKGRSLQTNEVTQEITDRSRVFQVLGTTRDIILQSTPTDDPSAMSNLYILTGHESSY